MSLNYSGERLMPGMQGEGATDHVHRYLLARQLATGHTVLDVACGEGYGSALLAEMAKKVIGVDIDSDAVAHAKGKYQVANLEFQQGDCARLPLADASVDLVVSFETIEHHDLHVEMLREIRRVLRPAGVLLISSPNRPEFNRDRSEPYPFHVKELDFGEFDSLLRAEFGNVKFYGQRSVSGSMVVPIDRTVAPFADFDEDEVSVPGLARPIYFIALASNGALPELGASIFESHQTEDFFCSAPTVRELRVYFSSECDQGYDQVRSYGVSYPENGTRQSIKLNLLSNTPPEKIRVDLSNAPSAVVVHAIALQQIDGLVAWQWDGGASVFRNSHGLCIRNTAAGLLFLCWNDDPQFELEVPHQVLAALQPNAGLVVEITPKPLAAVLSEVLSQDERTIADLRAGLRVSQADTTCGLDTHLRPPTLNLANDLENLAGLLKSSISRREQTIAQQTAQIKKMREELFRAEAQLDLLKDVMLHSREEDRL